MDDHPWRCQNENEGRRCWLPLGHLSPCVYFGPANPADTLATMKAALNVVFDQ